MKEVKYNHRIKPRHGEDKVVEAFGEGRWYVVIINTKLEPITERKFKKRLNELGYNFKRVYRGDNIVEDNFSAYDAAVYAHGQSSVSYQENLFLVCISEN